MYKKEKNRQNNGITLISLVITIIVMLILVGVSITLAVNGGLFEYAGNAVGDTKNAIAEENEIGNGGLEVDGEKYGSINEYLYGKPIEGHDGEMFSPIYKETTKITQTDGDKTYTAWIPKGFSVGISDTIKNISTGLVIRDAEGNEFVWIPVEKAIITESEIETLKTKYEVTSSTEAVKKLANEEGIYPMAVQVGENYKGILYDFSGTNTLTATVYDWTNEESYREPTNLSTAYDNTDNLGIWTGTLYQEAYNDMVKSVSENGGFYVGRYEISWGNYDLGNGSKVNYLRSRVGQDATMALVMGLYKYSWHDLYELESNYAKYNESLGVTSEMIWGSQWDQMMIFVNGKKDGNGNPFYVTLTGSRATISSCAKTGKNKVDQVANVFDLEAGGYEWSQTACGEKYRQSRRWCLECFQRGKLCCG